METSAHIDWISVTIKRTEFAVGHRANIVRLIRKFLPKQLSEMNWATHKPRNGYNVAMVSETGVVVMGHDDRIDMGIHIVTSGTTLANNEDIGLSAIDYFDWIIRENLRITRIDYAVDAINSEIEIGDLAQSILKKEHTSKARSAPYVDDKIRGGKTQYVGSMRNRTKLFRAYEKDIPGVLDDWKRFEIELHGNPARDSSLILSNSDNKAKTIQGIITGFIDFPLNETWVKIMGSDGIKIKMPAKQIGNTEKWLLESVAPSLAKLLDLDESVMFRFMKAVEKHRSAKVLVGKTPQSSNTGGR